MNDPRPLAETSPASPWCQRWNDGAHSWRHVFEGGFDRRDYEVHSIPDDTTAKDYIVANHYSRSYPSASFRYGLYRTGDLVGVAVFGTPTQPLALTNLFPDLLPYSKKKGHTSDASTELSRFVLNDEVPANGESWFLARCFTEVRGEGIRGVLSAADPVRRIEPDGSILCPGHVGTIYQASNALYCGRQKARKLFVLRDGTLNDRAMQKVRDQDQGHDYVEQRLIGLGARAMRAGENPNDWLWTALEDAGAERVQHGGNYRYAFQLGRNRKERGQVVVGLPTLTPYPKVLELAA